VGLSSSSLYKVPKCSLDEGWSIHPRSLTWEHESIGFFFSLAKGVLKNTMQSNAVDTEQPG